MNVFVGHHGAQDCAICAMTNALINLELRQDKDGRDDDER